MRQSLLRMISIWLLAAAFLCPAPQAHARTRRPAKPAHAAPAAKPATKPAADPAARPATAASADANAILRPVFTVDGQALEAGTAFVVRLGGGAVLLVTAHHLFGPDGGWDRDLTWEELPKLVTAVRATGAGGAVVVTGQRPLAMEGTATFHGNPAGGDVAAFKIADPGHATVLALAPNAPKAGDRIFLLAQVGSDQLLRHAATVAQVGPQHVMYRFDDRVELRATSGAPLVDAQNRVVAINLAGGGNPVIGVGNPVHAFGPKLERAVGAH